MQVIPCTRRCAYESAGRAFAVTAEGKRTNRMCPRETGKSVKLDTGPPMDEETCARETGKSAKLGAGHPLDGY